MPLSPSTKTTLPRGFAGSFDDQVATALDLNQHLITHPAATYFLRADGNNFLSHHVNSGDTLIVDRSLNPHTNDLVIAVIDGQLCLRQVVGTAGQLSLMATDTDKAIAFSEDNILEIWGVVTTSIHQHRS